MEGNKLAFIYSFIYFFIHLFIHLAFKAIFSFSDKIFNYIWVKVYFVSEAAPSILQLTF